MMQVMQRCPDLQDYSEIVRLLEQNNYDYNKVISIYKSSKKCRIRIIDCSSQAAFDVDFDPNQTGMDVVSHLIAVKPIQSNNSNSAYNFYHNKAKT